MWPSNELTERLGLKWPIVQAPMAGSTTPELAAAVSNAGGLGSLGLGTVPAEAGGAEIQAFGELSAGPLNANYFAHEDPGEVDMTGREMRRHLQRRYFEAGLGEVPVPSVPFGPFSWEHVEQIRDHRPEVVSFLFGLPDDDLVAAVKETGAQIWSNATTIVEAHWLVERGVDAVIAQGTEAGGHRGTFLGAHPTEQPGLFALLPQVAEAANVPVIAAGGVATGRSIAAALMLGASGVLLGTAFLRCPETLVHPSHRKALADATDISTRVTNLFSGKPGRALINSYMNDLRDAEEQTPPYPSQFSLYGPLRDAAPEDEAADSRAFWSGQAAGMTREMPAADLITLLATETDERLDAFR